MNTTAIYARVSSERQEKDETIHSQIAKLREYAKAHSYKMSAEYLDDGYSGELIDRPALDRLRNDARAGKIERLLILSPDRLARKAGIIYMLTEDLQKYGVAIQYLNQPKDATDESRLLLSITTGFAEYEKAKFVDRTRRGRIHKAKNGVPLAARPPFGYSYIRKTAGTPPCLVVDEQQAETVKLIFSLCVGEGLSVSAIIRRLAKRDIRPPKGGLFWAKSTIKKILKNESYCGTWHYGKHYHCEPFRRKSNKYTRALKTSNRLKDRKEWIAVPIPAIIDRQTYQQALDQIKRNTVFSPRNTKHVYLLGGLCRCGYCEQMYQGTPGHGKFYYRCNGPRINRLLPRTCFNPSQYAPRLEAAVWAALSKALLNPTLLNENFQGVKKRIHTTEDQSLQELERVKQEKASLAKSEERLLDVFSSGVITSEQLRSQMSKVQERRAKLDERESSLLKAAPSPAHYQDGERYCRALAKGLEKVEHDPIKKRELIRMLVTRVSVKETELVISGAIPAPTSPIVHGGVTAPITGLYGRYTPIPFELVTPISQMRTHKGETYVQ